jgi:hypothetical protein
MSKRPRITTPHELSTLKNVGPATLSDLLLIGITRIEQLKTAHPETLFHLLETKSGYKQNICMLDLFHAIIHEAQTGERMPWHYFSALRRKNL